jgi:hypothetical protein
MITPTILSFISTPALVERRFLSSSDPYSENLSLYLTSSEALWSATLSGGNISLSNVSIPASVSSYSIELTHYSSWKPQFETFSKYGFGLLGSQEPYPDGAILTVSGSSESDAAVLANALSQRFGLFFEPQSAVNGVYTFFSLLSFSTELNTYFWSLVPTYYGGFTSMFTQSSLTSLDLAFFNVTYSSAYSISFGGLSALSSTSFALYSQLGLSQSAYNYSSFAQSSTINVRVLGGLLNNASIPFTNDFSNFSASMSAVPKTVNGTKPVPNLNATLNFSFPTIQAYRQFSTLATSKGSSVSVTIFVKNISPSGTPTAENVFVNDSWIDSLKNDFNLTVPNTSGKWNLTSGQSETVAYAFDVLSSNGSFSVPGTPVTYQFKASNQTVDEQVLLNPETLVIGAQNEPLIEATATLSSASIQSGQTFSANVTFTNKGNGPAFSVKSSGLSKQNLPAGTSWSFIANSSATSLTSTNSTTSFGISWQDSSGANHTATTNTLSTFFSFGTPGSPGLSIFKSVEYFASTKSANISLTVQDSSANSVSNATVSDSIPSGILFVKSFNSTSLRYANGEVTANLSSILGHANMTFLYSVNFTNPVQDYLFAPANVGATWNGISVIHYSAGFALPLGVVGTKTASPSQAFQGSHVTVSLGIVNGGPEPIYRVFLNDTYDPFLNIINSSSNYARQLNSSQSLSAELTANLTGTPGTYNLSTVAASFIFSGYQESAFGTNSSVTIYSLPEANLTYSALKVEEAHNINIILTFSNPSNVTINDVMYALPIPAGLKIEYGGTSNFTGLTLGPHQNITKSFYIITSEPDIYQLSSTAFTFNYQGHQLNGVSNTLTLNIVDDKVLRYVIPVAVGFVLVLGTLFYIRRLSAKLSSS